jgi:hypothetical protein
MCAFRSVIDNFIIPSSEIQRFDNSSFILKDGRKVSVCRHMNATHSSLLVEFMTKYNIGPSIALIISFMKHCTCGEQGTHKPIFPEWYILTWRIPEDIDDHVKDFFTEIELEPFRKKMDGRKKKFDEVRSKIQEGQKLINVTKEHLAEYTCVANKLREEAEQLRVQLEESKMHSDALQNLIKANEKASQLFGSELATIDPMVSMLLEKWERKTTALSEPFSEKMKNLCCREKMVSDTIESIQSLSEKLEWLRVEEKQAHAAFAITEKDFWKKVNEFPLEKLPSHLSQQKKLLDY